MRKNVGGRTGAIDYFTRFLKNLKLPKSEIRTENRIEKDEPRFTHDNIKNFKCDKNLFDGKIFILTSNLTFSAGMLFSLELSDNNLATIVGEVPGNSSACCGDPHVYYTPISKFKFCISHRKVYRIDSTKDPDRLIPDVQVPAKDALNKVCELIKLEN